MKKTPHVWYNEIHHLVKKKKIKILKYLVSFNSAHTIILCFCFSLSLLFGLGF